MEDETEARQLIRSIRLELDADSTHATNKDRMIQTALQLLSVELYKKPDHFIFELVQNADDNKYASGASPQLSFIYRKDGFLWIGSNELGFTEANVRALCTIGESTKKVEGNRKGFVGEKGIGFKSVFAVADKVWIKSNALQFRFDKSKRLGMIAPEWCDFPSTELLNGRTMFCFHIEDAFRDRVDEDLRQLKPELLLFLRQLRKINVTVLKPNRQIERSFDLHRSDDNGSTLRVTTLSNLQKHPREPKTVEKFLICEHTATNMPLDEKRPGVTESDIMVAFPVTDGFAPLIEERDTFNFLPIRSYGFPFVLQADFILPASREDVFGDRLWNLSLIEATVDLFVNSVRVFNAENLLKYSWLKYLTPLSQAQGTAFEGFFSKLVARLQREAVIESQGSTMEKPQSLELVPAVFMDSTRPPQPLLPGTSGLRSSPHHLYSIADLRNLKITEQSSHQFLGRLRDLVKKSPATFQGKPALWHSRIAAAVTSSGLASKVGDLNMVPVRTGRWIASRNNEIFFPGLEDNLVIPAGIDVDVVRDVAQSDDARKRLFALLGVGDLTAAKVYTLILDQHRHHGTSYGSWTVKDVVEHAGFLFASPSKPYGAYISNLRLAAQGSSLLHTGNELYMDVPGETFKVSGVLGSSCQSAKYIHPEYLTAPPRGSMKEWTDWLQNVLGVRTRPKLAVRSGISPEFKSIIDNSRNNSWLTLLKDQWSSYATELRDHGSAKARVALSDTNVLCKSGNRWPLKSVYLATPSVLSEPLAQNKLRTLAVDDPDDKAWQRLSIINLRIAIDLEAYGVILLSMSRGSTDFSVDDVTRIYTGMQQHYADDPQNLKKHFAQHDLIYIDSPSPKWVKLADCRWTAPKSIRGLTTLASRYDGLKELFVQKLGVTNATAADVVGELVSLGGSAQSVEAIKSLLGTLNEFVKEGQVDNTLLQRVMQVNVAIVPVRGTRHQLLSFADTTWFIPDWERLARAFEGKVAFLDFDQVTQLKLKPLLDKLGVQGRVLSKHYLEETVTRDEGRQHMPFTTTLRAKARFLSRLAELPRQPELLRRCSELEVRCSDDLKLMRHVVINGQKVFASEDKGHSALKEVDGIFCMHLSSAAGNSSQLPTAPVSSVLLDLLRLDDHKKQLIMTILTTGDPDYIEDELERAGHGLAGTLGEAVSSDEDFDFRTTLISDGSAPPSTAAAPTSPAALSPSAGTQARNGAAAPARTKNGNPTRTQVQSTSVATGGNFDLGSIVAAATAGSGKVDVVTRKRLPARSRFRSSTPANGTVRSTNGHSMDMSSIRNTLSDILTVGNGAPTAGYGAAHSFTSAATESTAFQQEVGYAGEVFVYELLKKKFDIGDDCWTSNLRAGYKNFTPFDGDEDHADFTTSDPSVMEQIKAWLSDGESGAVEWKDGTATTYHIEVKATSGRGHESFDLSANQNRLAREFHQSENDVFIILRVSSIQRDPQLRAYIDPFALMMDGQLSFAAQIAPSA